MLCGLCLPHCPTYRLSADENESPRGRITLLRALAAGALPASDALAAHVSHCLGCRACERVCPSGVRYGQILHAGRALLAARRGRPWRARLALAAVAHRSWLQAVAALLRLYQRSGLQWLMRASGLLAVLGLGQREALLPPLTRVPRWLGTYPATGPARGRVALFLGCVARQLDAPTLDAGIRLLTRLGYEVCIPEHQECCGALHREAGDHQAAVRLHVLNRRAFAAENIEAVITLASGCTTALIEPPAGEPPLGVPVRDLLAFLFDAGLPQHAAFRPLNQTVAVHEPCTLRNVLRAEQAVYRLLARIPQLHIVPLPENALCCGGAGGTVLRETELAMQLRAAKLAHLETLKPDMLVSANIGCALHIAAGLRERGLAVPVVHPVVLLEGQLSG